MLNTIIVDDQLSTQQRLLSFIQRSEEVTLLECFDDPTNALAFLKESPECHVAFVDIEMPQMSGLDFARCLEDDPRYGNPYIVFSTGYPQYALDAFEYDSVIGYLTKGCQYRSFVKYIDRVKKNTFDSIELPLTTLAVKLNQAGKDRYIHVDYSEIKYVSNEKNYIRLHVGNEQYTHRQTLNGFLKKCGGRFVQIHRSYLLNPDYTNFFNLHYVHLKDGERLPISNGFRENLF